MKYNLLNISNHLKFFIGIAFVAMLFISGCGEQTIPAGNDSENSVSLYYPDPETTLNKIRIYFDWGGIEEANGYRILCWRDEELVIDQIEFGSSFKSLVPMLDGNYRWTVGVRYEDGDFTDWADTSSFSINQWPFKFIDATPTPGEAQSIELHSSEDIAYISDNYAGFTIVDYRNTPPTYEGNYIVDDSYEAQDRTLDTWIDSENDIIFVAGYSSTPRVICYDIADPIEPLPLLPYSLSINVNGLDGFYRNGTTYLMVSMRYSGIKIMQYPVLGDGITSYRLPYSVNGVTLLDSLCFVPNSDGGLYIFEINWPSEDRPSLSVLSRTFLPGQAEAVAIDSESLLAYVATGIGGLSVVDFSDPSNAEIVVHTDLQVGDAKDVDFVGNYLFLSTGSKGVIVYDITDRRNPIPVQEVATMYSNGVVADRDGSFCIADRDWGFVRMGM